MLPNQLSQVRGSSIVGQHERPFCAFDGGSSLASFWQIKKNDVTKVFIKAKR